MNSRNWKVCGLVFGLTMSVCPSAMAVDSRPSRDTLAEMGLGGLVVVSDNDALAIRGMGYKGSSSSVKIFGNSFATINKKYGTAHSENGYVAEGKHFAAGGNHSYAGATFKKSSRMRSHSKSGYGRKGGGGYGGGHLTIKSVKVFAGGRSWAKAF
jgi:hypothetical protein